MTRPQNLLNKVVILISVSLQLLSGCKKANDPVPPLSSDKQITGFVIKATDNSSVLSKDINGVIGADTIILTFPQGTVINKIIPTISFAGKTLTPSSKTVQDFTGSVRYTVTAEDSSTKTYIVTVNFLNTAKAITSFTFQASDNPGALSSNAQGIIGSDTIVIYLPAGTKVNNLTPAIGISGKSISPASHTSRDFTHPVVYTVTAQDGTTKNYVVVVTTPAYPPVIGTVYIGNDAGNLFALDAATGKLKWKYASGYYLESSLTVANGLVYAANGGVGGENNVFAVDTGTGVLKWNFRVPGGVINSSPDFSNGNIYIGSFDENLYCINAITGQLNWKFKTDSAIYSSPTVANGVVYVGCDDNNLYAIDASTGSLKWKFSAGIYGGGVQSSPAVANGVVYVGCNTGNVYALNAATGAEIWAFSTDLDNIFASSPTVVNGVVYIGSTESKLYAIDANSGTLLWSFLMGNQTQSSPIVSNGVVYIGCEDGYFYAVNAVQGTLKWMTAVGSDQVASGTSPTVFGGMVYVGCDDGDVYAMDATSGTLIWKYATGSILDTGSWAVHSSPCITDAQGKVYHPGISGEQQ